MSSSESSCDSCDSSFSPLSESSSLAQSLGATRQSRSSLALAAGAAREAALRLRLATVRDELAQERASSKAALKAARDLCVRLAAAVAPAASAKPGCDGSGAARSSALVNALLAQREAELCAARRERDEALASLEAVPRLRYVGAAAALLESSPQMRRRILPTAKHAPRTHAAVNASTTRASNSFNDGN